MTFNEAIAREEQLNEHVNWIVTGGMIGTAIGFIIFCILAMFNAFAPASIIQVVFMAIGLLAGIPLQITKRKKATS